MACQSCAEQRAAVMQAIRRGQVATAAAIAAKGAAQVAQSLKPPPLIRKR